jgi:hypothetical protein
MKLLYNNKMELQADLLKSKEISNNLLIELKNIIKNDFNYKIDIYTIKYKNGVCIEGKLIIGNNIIKEYSNIDLLFLDINNLILDLIIKNRRF